MARRIREEVDEEEDEMDELERAEASIRERQKKKDKSGKKDKGKGKEKERSSRHNASESEPEEEESDGVAATAGGAGGRGKGLASDSSVKELARDLVRFAICNEVSRRPLRRDEINKKVLLGATRNFQKVFDEANAMLESVWGMELVPLYPNEPEDPTGADSDKKKKKKNKSNDNDGAASASSDEEESDVKKAKRRGPPKLFCLRSRLPTDIIKKAVKSNDSLNPEDQARYDEDLRGALGDALAGTGQRADEELKEWKRGDDTILDWKTGPEQRTLFGILYVILALIMVNERVLSDEQLQNHLKRLDLRFDTRLPLNVAAVRPEKQTLGTVLQALIRQQYLERTKISSGPVKGKANATQGGSTQTQRVRSTQAAQRQAAEDGLGGDPNSEWRWGPRAFREFGEDGVASFLKDFYRSINHSAAGGRGGNANQKDGKTLLTEITKGATGNRPEDGLIPARDD